MRKLRMALGVFLCAALLITLCACGDSSGFRIIDLLTNDTKFQLKLIHQSFI